MPEAFGTLALKCPIELYEYFDLGSQIAWEDLAAFFKALGQPDFERLAQTCNELRHWEGESFIVGATCLNGQYIILQVEGEVWRDITELLVKHQDVANVYGVIEGECGDKTFYLREDGPSEITRSFNEDTSIITDEESAWRKKLPEELLESFTSATDEFD